MNWSEEIDMYGEIGALEQARADQEWQAYVEGEA